MGSWACVDECPPGMFSTSRPPIPLLLCQNQWDAMNVKCRRGTCVLWMRGTWNMKFKEMSSLRTKPRKWLCAQQRQISLGICPVWSEASLCAQWVAKDPSLIRVFAVRSVGSYGLKLSSCGQRRLWSDWADAQADLSLHWAHMPLCWFCHAAAQINWFGSLFQWKH